MITPNCFLSRNKFILTIERISPPFLILFFLFEEEFPMYFIASTGEQFIAIFAGFRLLITVVAKENTDAMINTHTDTASTSPGIIVGLRACNTCGITNLPTMAEQ